MDKYLNEKFPLVLAEGHNLMFPRTTKGNQVLFYDFFLMKIQIQALLLGILVYLFVRFLNVLANNKGYIADES